MGTHPSGDGAAWDSLEAVDIDQPAGLDYRYSTHLAIAVRKRIGQEHSTFGDTTAGGIHTPGGVAVLGMEITDAAGDPTSAVVADGTYRAHGLVWSYVVEAGANKGTLWCATAAAGASTTGDWTLMKLHPDLQWGGGDITWAGGHEFDASIDITGPVWVDGSCDFSDVHVAGDLTVAGAILVDGSCDFSDIYIEGDFSADGTAMLQNTVLTGDSTLTFDAIAGETGPTVKMFGDWSAKAVDETFTARTDGIVITTVEITNVPNGRRFKFETPAGTTRVDISAPIDAATTMTVPVKGGDTWAVTFDATGGVVNTTTWFLPFGDNT